MTARAPEFRGLLNNLRARLEAERVPFAIGGSFATAARGYVRGTKDIDVMLLLHDQGELERVHRALLAPPPRFSWMNEVTFRDEETDCLVKVRPTPKRLGAAWRCTAASAWAAWVDSAFGDLPLAPS